MRTIVLSLAVVLLLALTANGCSSSSAQSPSNPFPIGVNPFDGMEVLQVLRLADGTFLLLANELGFSGLYVSDGTLEGTELLVPPDPAPGFSPSNIFPETFNGGYYFEATTTDTGNELWFTDGTSAGTVLIRDVHPGPANSIIRDILIEGDLMTVLIQRTFAGTSEPLYTELITIAQ